MLFNSPAFLLFFPAVVLLAFSAPNRLRWAVLLAASCGFYMAWKPVYILLLLVPCTLDYAVALGMSRWTSSAARRCLLALSLAGNLGLLFYFKYYNFFADTFRPLCPGLPAADVILPVGISFYTFQALAYTIDVYRGTQAPVRHFGRFLLYITYFPQLVAGPIERPQNLLPQLEATPAFDADRAAVGLRWMLWGLFKKVVIADRLGPVVDAVYADPRGFGGPALVLATVFFAFQIYCDFSGYTDIAVGAAKVLGVDLMRNFRKPYFAESVSDFWRRWHISLSTWFRDYVYYPMGGNRGSAPRRSFNAAVVFLVSGLWHGASWTFVIWGGLHAVFFILHAMMERRGVPRLPRPLRIAATFSLVCFAWIFFRAADLDQALHVATHLFSGWGAGGPLGAPAAELWTGGALVALLLAVEGATGEQEPADFIDARPARVRWAVYYALFLLILALGVFEASPFIYFQF